MKINFIKQDIYNKFLLLYLISKIDEEERSLSKIIYYVFYAQFRMGNLNSINFNYQFEKNKYGIYSEKIKEDLILLLNRNYLSTKQREIIKNSIWSENKFSYRIYEITNKGKDLINLNNDIDELALKRLNQILVELNKSLDIGENKKQSIIVKINNEINIEKYEIGQDVKGENS